MSAWIDRQAPSSGAASWLRANRSTRSHHSRARSQSPAVVLATTRLQYALARVWMLRTRPADAAAIASSSSTIPVSHRPALTSLRPSTLRARTSRSPSAAARAIVMASWAYAIWSSTADAVRARWTATQPCPAQRSTSATARSARASQPRAAEVRPAISCWLETQTATRAASLHRPSAAYASKARSRAAMPSATSPRNQRASPSPSYARAEPAVARTASKCCRARSHSACSSARSASRSWSPSARTVIWRLSRRSATGRPVCAGQSSARRPAATPTAIRMQTRSGTPLR